MRNLSSLFAALAMAGACTIALVEEATALRRPNAGTYGYCPVGSCAMDGSKRAANVKNCSPANCRR